MSERDIDRLHTTQKDPSVRVVGVLGSTEKLLREKDSLKPYNSWMGITTSRKTYSDELVVDFARWGSQHSGTFMLVIADSMQVYNQMARDGADPDALTLEQRSKYRQEVADYKRAARKRMGELNQLVNENGLTNVKITLWSKLLDQLASAGWEDRFIIDMYNSVFHRPGLDKKFDEDMTRVTREKARHILVRSQNPETCEFIASHYSREQMVLTMTLATLGIYGYAFKVGIEAERTYDEIAQRIFLDGFGSLKMDGKGSWNYGTVYLRRGFRWDVETYIHKVENSSNLLFQEYQRAEVAFLTNNIKDSGQKTFIDVGAGYGRLVSYLAPVARQVIGVEIDENMAEALSERSEHYQNVKVKTGDANELNTVLKDTEIYDPVIVAAQNSLGTWKGDRNEALDEMKRLAEGRGGEIVISLLRQEALRDWGISFYATLEELAGKYDPEASNLGNGFYRTDIGYESHWFSKEEIEAMKQRLGGKVVDEVVGREFHIFHISYSS